MFVAEGILQWEKTGNQSATLLSSERLKYWELNGVNGANYLERIGLQKRPMRTP